MKLKQVLILILIWLGFWRLVSPLQARTTTKELMNAAISEYENSTGENLSKIQPKNYSGNQLIAYRFGYAQALRYGYYTYNTCLDLGEGEYYFEAIIQGCQDHFTSILTDFIPKLACSRTDLGCQLDARQEAAASQLIADLDKICQEKIGDCRYFWPKMTQTKSMQNLFSLLAADSFDPNAYQAQLLEISQDLASLIPTVIDQETADQQAALGVGQELMKKANRQ